MYFDCLLFLSLIAKYGVLGMWELAIFGRKKPHNGMVRRGILEVVEFEDGGSHETTRDRY